jgi:hypothetical protein
MALSSLGSRCLKLARAVNAVVHRRSLRRLDTNPLPREPGEIRLFAVLRNEASRLPWFLRYYEKLGVNRFLIVDNDSSDATRDILLSRRNVHVFHTKRSYKNSEYGCIWREVLFRDHGFGHWCVVVDADEMLIYPDYETTDLRGLAAAMQAEGALGLRATWVQMYSDIPVRKTAIGPEDDPLHVCPYFDRNTLERGPHPLKLGWIPSTDKAPFFFMQPGGPSVWVGQHEFVWSDGIRREPQIATIRGAVLHFKFVSELYDKAREEMRRRVHVASDRKYGGFLYEMNYNPDLTLVHEGSIKFEGSRQMVDLGIMATGRETPERRPISPAQPAGWMP